MKQYTTIKVGYTTGIYGCSGEYFTTIIVDDKGISSLAFHGMYGVEDRVARALNDKGFKAVYTPSDYGQMKSREVNKHLFVSEQEILKQIETI